MPTIGPEYKGCRYWGYEPAAADIARSPMNDRDAREEARKKLGLIRQDAKAHGLKATEMGLTKKLATSRAEKLEAIFPGVAWLIFNHDYL